MTCATPFGAETSRPRRDWRESILLLRFRHSRRAATNSRQTTDIRGGREPASALSPPHMCGKELRGEAKAKVKAEVKGEVGS